MIGLLGGLLGSGCQRTPEEPKPNPSTTAPPSTPVAELATEAGATSSSAMPAAPSSGTSGGQVRCIAPLAEQATPVPPKAKTCPKDPEGGSKLTTANLVIGDAKIVAELVWTEHDTSKGLMYRTAMAEDHGMLFRLSQRKIQQFWMHNTCIPLDLLYVDEDGTIVGIVENAPTLDDDVRAVDCPSRYVLELNAGYARRHKIKPGQSFALPDAIRNAP